ncbi:methionine--tRNA ligase [Parvimonas sp. C2]|uniref:methionine--tRNA ligase n=1 Tax=Parvimonas sp. C2 TaxID=3110692 RepID=UPI002B48366B|nr:methionine--tRNA ligase [Parvimonas sp. C2]MEB3073378.1 methionine--tRNA ligase [Parvimonas sp. C2]
MEKKNFYLTTPIYYPNSNLHLGHTYTTIVADVLKKYKQAQGFDVFFTTGTDEHGQKLEESAIKAGKAPLEYIDPIVESAKELWRTLDIDFDAFVRSTDKIHEKNVSEIFTKLYEKGEIYKGSYKGMYCVPCEAFWTESQLVEGNKCPDCGREVSPSEEETYFFRLSKYQNRLLKLYEENPDFIQPESRKNEMISFINEGLTDLSVTRSSFDWGVKVPFDEKHVVYVWIDALSCYLTGIGYGTDEEKFNKFWPCDVHLIGKEIMRFHAIIWPAILMALDLPLPKKIFGHGWILFDDDKMSKSKGNIVYAEPIIERYGMDALRYFMLREFTFGQDGNFTYTKMLNRINSDLVNDLGNLVSRSVAMCEKYFGGIVPAQTELTELDNDLIETATTTRDRVAELMDKLNFSMALEEIWKLVRRTNKYIDETTPWTLIKEQKEERLKTVIYNLLESIRIISGLIKPFMKETSLRINEQIGYSDYSYEDLTKFGLLKVGTKVCKGKNLFDRLDVDKELEIIIQKNSELIELRKKKNSGADDVKEEVKESELITIDDFAKVELKVGKILECQPHPKADRLLVFKIDIGDEVRTIVSGIRKYYSETDLIGKKVIVVTNLKPVNLRGVESNGMILAASDDENLSVLTVLNDVKEGSKVS